MTTPLYCLLGFAAWTILLVTVVGLTRASEVLRGRKRANEFPSGVPHGGDRYWRLNRAHINATENLPIFGAAVLVGTLAHLTTPSFALMCQVVLAARVAQSLVHISSGRSLAVNVRFACYVVQLTCIAAIMFEIVRRAR